MKIIISHDVDHLYATDHLTRDLILPKMWIRSFLHLLKKKIRFRTFVYRLSILLHNRMTRIDEVMSFDREHGIPSVFFFGMDRILGMSYSRDTAAPFIKSVLERGFDAGVHGVDYEDGEAIATEYRSFAKLSGIDSFGIRNHYVRFDEQTFDKMNEAGYLFDSTWFNKQRPELRGPYKVGSMWEFPLHIMDVYVCKPGKLQEGLENTFALVKEAETLGLPYCTILFHDYQFDDGQDPQMKQWYIQTVEWLERNGYQFISYRDAIKELEEKNA